MAQIVSEMPDPAAAPAAGVVEDPKPLENLVAELTGTGESNLQGEHGDVEWGKAEEVATPDRDEFVKMVVQKESEGSRLKPPAAFMHREAFRILSEKDLTCLPDLPGAGIYYHQTTFQWHSSWQTGNRAPKWGSNRSEIDALLLALIGIWEHYVELNSNDKEAQVHLEKLKKELGKNDMD